MPLVALVDCESFNPKVVWIEAARAPCLRSIELVAEPQQPNEGLHAPHEWKAQQSDPNLTRQAVRRRAYERNTPDDFACSGVDCHEEIVIGREEREVPLECPSECRLALLAPIPICKAGRRCARLLL